MIDVRDVSKQFGATHAVRHVSLRVAAGQVWCLLGANGAGKTTLLDICLGFTAPDSGAVSVGGHDVVTAPDEARRLTGYVPEHVGLYDALTGVEHLEFFSALGQAPLGRAEAVRALTDAGVDGDAVTRPVGTYSKGMRQKVALAIALAKQASALLLDEPLSGLDPKAALDLSVRLKALGREGRAILLTSHDLYRALDTATHVAIMRAGEVRYQSTTAALTHGDLETRYLEIMTP